MSDDVNFPEDKNASSDCHYDVGYGKPPADRQFQKGRSGNPSGRPKSTENFADSIFEAIEDVSIIVNRNGKKIKLNGLKAVSAKTVNDFCQNKKYATDLIPKILLERDKKMVAENPSEKLRTVVILPAKKSLKDES